MHKDSLGSYYIPEKTRRYPQMATLCRKSNEEGRSTPTPKRVFLTPGTPYPSCSVTKDHPGSCVDERNVME